MIERYQRNVMKKLWSLDNKFHKYLEIEISNVKALNYYHQVSDEDLEKVKKASFSLDRIKEIEQITKHDVIAFTRAVGETLGEEKKWIHYGLTSTDVVDTANALLIKEANDIILDDLNKFIDVIKEMAIKYKETPCIGRTHGMHADITSFGLKFALYYSDLLRIKEEFLSVRKIIEVGKLSGAVGNFANIDPKIEEYVCKDLNLNNALISTQVIQRDRYASYFFTLSLISSELEKIALEIRLLASQEIKEVEEGFSKGQKGSSAMPHKKNPISCENICGCNRLMKSYLQASFDNIPLWHERDISHSSVERVILEDATSLLDYMLNRMTGIITNLTVFEDKMKKNIYLTKGVIFSQQVLYTLLSKGLSREEAYDYIQPCAIRALEEDKQFKDVLKNDSNIKKYLSDEEIDNSFKFDYYFKNVDYIYHRLKI